MSKLTDQQIAKVEDQILSAVDNGVIRPGQNVRFMFGGALATLEALGYEIPPIWSIWLMSGRDIYKEINNSRAKKLASQEAPVQA